MVQARRRSVDAAPLSQTLVALKRVRSLRDPETNSMDKFCMFVEDINWETSSAKNDPILKLNDDSDDADSIHSTRLHETERRSANRSRQLGLTRGLDDSGWLRHSPEDLLEEQETKKINARARRKSNGRPYLSPIKNDMPSPRAPGSFDLVESGQGGCGLGNCWSRTPKHRDLECLSDEGQSHPLIVDGDEMSSSYPSSPTSLNQKYRPRSFDELVGQPLVVQSLANAVCKRKVSPIYLFHGPHGTGKTSAARIFASGLNCLSLGDQIPCGVCKECVSFLSGKTSHVKELDPARLDSSDKVKELIKRLSLAPIRSSYRAFIVDECQDIHVDAWTTILNGVQLLSCSQVVFIMITSDLEKLPPLSLASCQRYHFPKIKDADIVRRLRKICSAEALDFEDEALTFAAARSNGSLREAETMLDQLSLLGKRITLSLARELAGVVSEEELLEVLDLALSCDTPNIVRRARELLSSKVDPMQLTSQLANLIMDILAGRCRADNPAGRMFSERHASGDVGLLQKLRNALRVLSETEKQLRSSKSRATWLTVALLQLNAQDSADADYSVSTLTFKHADDDDDDDDDDMLPRGSLWARESVISECNRGTGSDCFERYCNASRKLDAVWRRTVELCHPRSDLSRAFLKKGRLTSIYLKQGLAVAQVEFSSPENVARAEASWKLINSSLQRVLCHEAELRISLARRCSSLSKVKELTLRLLGCSLGKRRQYALDDSHLQIGKQACRSTSKKCGMDSRVIAPGEERLARLAKLQRSNTSPTGRLGSSLLPSRGASPEAFLCNRVSFVFCSRRRHQPS